MDSSTARQVHMLSALTIWLISPQNAIHLTNFSVKICLNMKFPLAQTHRPTSPVCVRNSSTQICLNSFFLLSFWAPYKRYKWFVYVLFPSLIAIFSTVSIWKRNLWHFVCKFIHAPMLLCTTECQQDVVGERDRERKRKWIEPWIYKIFDFFFSLFSCLHLFWCFAIWITKGENFSYKHEPAFIVVIPLRVVPKCKYEKNVKNGERRGERERLSIEKRFISYVTVAVCIVCRFQSSRITRQSFYRVIIVVVVVIAIVVVVSDFSLDEFACTRKTQQYTHTRTHTCQYTRA